MKMDLMIVPCDTLVIGSASRRAMSAADAELQVVPRAEVMERLVHRLVGGSDEPVAGISVGPALLAREVSGRVEPLYPAPDDLVVDERPRESMFVQPAFLEPIRGDFVRHDHPAQRALVSSSRRAKAPRLGGFLTRKGVRVWAERKAERFAEGDHFWSARRLFEIESRRGADGEREVHVRLRPGVGFVMSVELADGVTAPKLPMVVPFPGSSVAVRVEETQLPMPDLRAKPGRRWRVWTLSSQPASAAGMPEWFDEEQGGTRAPLPTGGRLSAVASKRLAGGVEGTGRPLVAAGTTWFLEFNDPVRVDPTAWILAGGY